MSTMKDDHADSSCSSRGPVKKRDKQIAPSSYQTCPPLCTSSNFSENAVDAYEKNGVQDEEEEEAQKKPSVCSYRDYSHMTADKGGKQASLFKVAPAKSPTFPITLHRMLAIQDFEGVISWMPHGRSWKILKTDIFEERVLPLFFCHGRLASFMRQVNGWGFRRIKHGPDYNSYYNELFLRGLPHLAEKMRRSADDKKPKTGEDTVPPDFYKISKENPLPETSVVPDGSDYRGRQDRDITSGAVVASLAALSSDRKNLAVVMHAAQKIEQERIALMSRLRELSGPSAAMASLLTSSFNQSDPLESDRTLLNHAQNRDAGGRGAYHPLEKVHNRDAGGTGVHNRLSEVRTRDAAGRNAYNPLDDILNRDAVGRNAYNPLNDILNLDAASRSAYNPLNDILNRDAASRSAYNPLDDILNQDAASRSAYNPLDNILHRDAANRSAHNPLDDILNGDAASRSAYNPSDLDKVRFRQTQFQSNALEARATHERSNQYDEERRILAHLNRLDGVGGHAGQLNQYDSAAEALRARLIQNADSVLHNPRADEMAQYDANSLRAGLNPSSNCARIPGTQLNQYESRDALGARLNTREHLFAPRASGDTLNTSEHLNMPHASGDPRVSEFSLLEQQRLLAMMKRNGNITDILENDSAPQLRFQDARRR